MWAENYDAQPGNLMLDLDELIFSDLLGNIPVANFDVADIGCGTGRHWAEITGRQPKALTGYDVSTGMLDRLKEKFPQAHTCRITNNRFSATADATYDLLISTLTIAHIEDIDEALTNWCRILKPDADIIITDFHPAALALGGKRTFEHQKGQVTVRNFIHPVNDIEQILQRHNFYVVKRMERVVDASVKHYYSAKNALHVYREFENCPIIYGLHLRRR